MKIIAVGDSSESTRRVIDRLPEDVVVLSTRRESFETYKDEGRLTAFVNRLSFEKKGATIVGSSLSTLISYNLRDFNILLPKDSMGGRIVEKFIELTGEYLSLLKKREKLKKKIEKLEEKKRALSADLSSIKRSIKKAEGQDLSSAKKAADKISADIKEVERDLEAANKKSKKLNQIRHYSTFLIWNGLDISSLSAEGEIFSVMNRDGARIIESDSMFLLDKSNARRAGKIETAIRNFSSSERVSDKEILKMVVKEIDNKDMKIKTFSSDVINVMRVKNDLMLESSIGSMFSIEKPLAPTRPSLVGAMLASGSLGQMDNMEVVDENDNRLVIKSSLVPIVKENQIEMVSITGREILKEKTFLWENRVGVVSVDEKTFIYLDK